MGASHPVTRVATLRCGVLLSIANNAGRARGLSCASSTARGGNAGATAARTLRQQPSPGGAKMRGFLAVPETRVAVVGWRQFLAKVNQVADRAHRAGQTEHRAGEHRRQRALPARGTTRVGHRAHRLGQTFGTAQRPGQRSEGPRLFSGQRRQRIGRTYARVRAPGAQPESLRRGMRHVRVIAAPRETGRVADLNPARSLMPGAGVTGRIHDSLRRSGSTPVRSRPCAGEPPPPGPTPEWPDGSAALSRESRRGCSARAAPGGACAWGRPSYPRFARRQFPSRPCPHPDVHPPRLALRAKIRRKKSANRGRSPALVAERCGALRRAG